MKELFPSARLDRFRIAEVYIGGLNLMPVRAEAHLGRAVTVRSIDGPASDPRGCYAEALPWWPRR